MANELKIIITAVEQGVKQTIAGVQDGFKRAGLAITAFNQSLGNGNQAIAGIAGELKTLIGAYAGLEGIRQAVTIVQASDKAIFNLGQSISAASREFGNVGSMEDWEQTIQRLSGELKVYSNTALREAASRTIDMTKRLGLEKDQMEQVIIAAANLGAGKYELSESVERVTAALRGEAEASEALGLTLSETYVKGWHEANNATGKAWKDLTDIERAQVRYNVLLEQAAGMQGRAAASAETLNGAWMLMKKAVDDAIAGNQDLVGAMKDVARALADNASGIASVGSAIIGAIAGLIRFAIEWRGLLAALIGTGVAVAAVMKLVAAVQALNVAWTVMTGMGVVAWAASVSAAMTQLAASASAAGLAMRAGVAAAAALGAYNIALATQELLGWIAAERSAAAANANLAEQSRMLVERYKEFATVQIPGNLTALAQHDLDALREKLIGARAYYTALANQMRATGNTAGLQEATARLGEINSALKRIGSTASVELRKPAAAVLASEKAIKDFEASAKKAYDEAINKAGEYGRKALDWAEKIRQANLTAEERIREIRRQSMSEEQKRVDSLLNYEEKIKAARELAAQAAKAAQAGQELEAQRLAALADKAYDAAEKAGQEYYQDIRAAAKDNAFELRRIDEAEIDRIAGVTKERTERVYGAMQDMMERLRAESQSKAEQINTLLADVARDREAHIGVELDNIESVQRQLEELTKDETKHIYIKVHKSNDTGSSGSDDEGYATGGRLPGYGGGDRIRALLEAGEFVMRKEAVRKYGAGLFEALNAMRLSIGRGARQRVSDRLGASLAPIGALLPQLRMAAGGAVSPQDAMIVEFRAGQVSAPLTVMGRPGVTRETLRQLNVELRKMGLSMG